MRISDWSSDVCSSDLIYQHTQGKGLGLPDGIYPPDHDALRACLASERPLAIVRAQAEGAASNGIAATPTLHLRDERTGQSLWLQGPIQGDTLLSAMEDRKSTRLNSSH